MVRTLCFHCQGPGFNPLVRELGLNKLCSMAKKKRSKHFPIHFFFNFILFLKLYIIVLVLPNSFHKTSLPSRCCCLVAQLCPTLSRPHGLYPAWLLCRWDSPGKNTGVGSHFLLQGIFPTQVSHTAGRFFTI